MAIDKAKLLKVADKHIAKQNYNKALNELLKVLKVAAGDVNLLNKIGDLYSKLGKNKNAIDYFLKVAESYQTSGFNLKAIALYKKIIRLDDKYMDARHRLVDLYIQQGYHSETKGELRRMAEYYYGENLFARALTCYEKMVEIDPNNLDARIKITELLVREGKRDQAIEHFVTMARDLLDKTMVNEAKKIISQGLKMSPEHPGLLILLSQTCLAEGKTDEALNHLTEICQNEPNNLEALHLLGQTYLSRGQLEEAKMLYLRAFELEPGDPTQLEEISRQMLEAGKVAEAFACIKPLGEMFMERREHEEATRLFRSILYVDEGHIPSQEMLVRIYRESNQTSNALLSLEKVVHHYLDAGNEDMARARIDEILELDPNNQEWRDKLSELSTGMSGADLEADEIHVFDEQSMDTSVIDDGTLDVDLSSQVSDEEADPQSRLANHITEAKVFLKYGIMDQALEHLEAAKDLDFLNVEVNGQLKTIYLEKGDLKKAIPCMISLVNAALEERHFQRAYQQVDELARYNAEIAEIHRGRIETIANDPSISMAPQEAPPSSDGFDLDFGDAMPLEPESEEGLMFGGAPDSEDVVDFRDMKQAQQARQDGTDGWALDMPAAEVEEAPKRRLPGIADDFAELYDPAKLVDHTGAHDLPDLADLADDSRLDLSLPEDLAQDAAELLDVESSDFLDISIGQVSLSEKAPQEAEKPKREDVKHAALDSVRGGGLASELEEIDFFISVEAYEDARNLIEDARKNFGEHPLLMERQHELDAKTQTPQMASDAMAESPSSGSLFGDESESTGFFDLAAELNNELFEGEAAVEINDATSKEEIQSVEELFQEFRKGVDEQIDEGDHETHYDLGIAYKEMGLLEEAIVEFTKASADPNKFLECAIMIGNCMIELGRSEDAIAHYKEKLLAEGLTDEIDLALRYDLAQAYQSFGELEKALEYLREIQGRDSGYRDVSELIDALV